MSETADIQQFSVPVNRLKPVSGARCVVNWPVQESQHPNQYFVSLKVNVRGYWITLPLDRFM